MADARLPAIKAELKWLTGELDAARNLDVFCTATTAPRRQREHAEGSKGSGQPRLRG